MDNLVSIRGLRVDLMSIHGLVHAVRNINLEICSGEIHGIVGESGCGKSMTAKSIMRLHDESKTEYGGEIILDGKKDILKMKKKELLCLRGKEVAMIFQDPMTTFNPLMTIGEQITEVLTAHENLTQAQAKDRAVELLEHVGILPGAERFHMYPFEMSGGQLQRASIAMSLSCNPRLLIADEPTTALDVTMQAQILELMKNLQRELKSAVLIITHNFGVIAEVCDKVSVMYAGQIVETGDVHEIFYRPCHPYTRDLIDSIPKPGERATKLVSIPGAPPALNKPIVGCPYAPRCTHACDRCFQKSPEVRRAGENHLYSCFLDPDFLRKEVT
jgi:oligopeptide/dipeptide ABC transporter ATP-binding protein